MIAREVKIRAGARMCCKRLRQFLVVGPSFLDPVNMPRP